MRDPNTYAQKLSRMIQSPTVGRYYETDLTRFYEFHDLLKELFPTVFSTCDVEDFNGSLLLRWKGEKSDAPILFLNHHDVVEAPGAWDHAPFSGDIADGKVWGRGALDTKGGLFAMLQAAEELMQDGFVPAQDIYFESACTEECDGSGADTISRELEKRGIHFRYALDEGGLIVYDPIGGANGYFAMIGVSEKGCAEIRFTARSKGGHASRPGKNTPLVRLGKFMAAVDRSHIFPPHCSKTVKEMLLRTGRRAHGFLRFFLRHPYLRGWFLAQILPVFSVTGRALVETTIAFTMAGASDAANVLPQEAWVVGNMRYTYHQGREGSLAAIKKIADRYKVEMEVLDPGFAPPLSDFKAPAFLRMEEAVQRFFPGVEAVPYIETSASDNRFMSRVADNCYGFSPFLISDEQLDSIHGLNENVNVSSLAPAVDFYKYLMKDGTDHE